MDLLLISKLKFLRFVFIKFSNENEMTKTNLIRMLKYLNRLN